MVNKTEDTYQTEDEESSLLATTHFPACYFCGQKKHPRSKCPARDVFCGTCGKKGHFQRVCRGAATMHKPVSSAMRPVISVTTAAAGPKSLKQAMVRVEINGKHFSALIDSGRWDSFVKGHFQRVCRGAATIHKPVSSAMRPVISVTTAAARPKSLKQAMVRVEINGKHFSALIDSGSSDSFVNAAIAKQLKWPIFSSTNTISMASTNFTKQTQGHCSVKLLSIKIRNMRMLHFHSCRTAVLISSWGMTLLEDTVS